MAKFILKLINQQDCVLKYIFSSNKRPYSIAVLWGIQYVYDFLKSKFLIDDDNYLKAKGGPKAPTLYIPLIQGCSPYIFLQTVLDHLSYLQKSLIDGYQ